MIFDVCYFFIWVYGFPMTIVISSALSLILEFGLSSNSLGGKIARKILDCDDKELIERLLDVSRLTSPQKRRTY